MIKLPEFPTPESYRSWKTAAREKIRAASDSPDEAFEWVLEVYRPGASHDSLRSPGKFLTLDTKLLEALTTVSRGELAGEILIFKETEAAKDRAVRGRQVLYLFDQYFKTNEEVGSLYSVEDLLKVRLINDDLSTFLSNWESVMSGLSHMPDETTVRDIFLRELRQSKRLKYDLEIYDRAKEGSEQHSYAFLKNSIREMLTRERKRKNRDRIARSHGDKYGAAASPRSTSPLTEVAVKGRKAREVRDPEARAEEGHRAPTNREPRVPKVSATTVSKVHASVARIAHSSTRRGPFPLVGRVPQRRLTRLVSSGSWERAPKVTNAGFNTRMSRSHLLQPRNRRPHLLRQIRDPQGPTLQPQGPEEEAQDQNLKGSPTSQPAACAFAAAAPRARTSERP